MAVTVGRVLFHLPSISRWSYRDKNGLDPVNIRASCLLNEVVTERV